MDTPRRTIWSLPSTTLCALALFGLILAAPLHSQSHKGGLSLVSGGSMHGDLTSGAGTPTVLETGWLAGLQAERWIGSGRTGMRLNSLFAQRLVEGGGDYNVVAADLDMLIRMLPAVQGRSFAPYAAFGAGATYYDNVSGTLPLGNGLFGGDGVVRAHLLAGLGADMLSSRRGGLRLEVADKIVLPSVGESPPATGLPMVHNLVVTAGVQLRFGAPTTVLMAQQPVAPAAPATVAIQPAPAEPRAGRGEALEADAGFTVQVGSFVEAETAGRWAERLRRRGIPVWLMETEIQGERVSRVRVGALDSESEAHSLAAALERDYGWSVWVDTIAPDEPRPDDAITRTRDFLYEL